MYIITFFIFTLIHGILGSHDGKRCLSVDGKRPTVDVVRTCRSHLKCAPGFSLNLVNIDPNDDFFSNIKTIKCDVILGGSGSKAYNFASLMEWTWNGTTKISGDVTGIRFEKIDTLSGRKLMIESSTLRTISFGSNNGSMKFEEVIITDGTSLGEETLNTLKMLSGSVTIIGGKKEKGGLPGWAVTLLICGTLAVLLAALVLFRNKVIIGLYLAIEKIRLLLEQRHERQLAAEQILYARTIMKNMENAGNIRPQQGRRAQETAANPAPLRSAPTSSDQAAVEESPVPIDFRPATLEETKISHPLPQEYALIKEQDLTQHVLLGEGSYGLAVRALHPHHGIVVAKYFMDLEELDDGILATRQWRELSVGLRINGHQNIVKTLASLVKENRDVPTGLVLEYLPGGDLMKYVQRNPVTELTRLNKWTSDLAKGLSYLHTSEIIHRDLKPPNILITRDYTTVKIADFGHSKKFYGKYHTLNLGTLLFQAPEVFFYHEYTLSSDVYSFGASIFYLHYSVEPFTESELPDVFCPDAAKNLKNMKASKLTGKPIDRIIYKTWRGNPSKRPPITDVVHWMDSPEGRERYPRIAD